MHFSGKLWNSSQRLEQPWNKVKTTSSYQERAGTAMWIRPSVCKILPPLISSGISLLQQLHVALLMAS